MGRLLRMGDKSANGVMDLVMVEDAKVAEALVNEELFLLSWQWASAVVSAGLIATESMVFTAMNKEHMLSVTLTMIGETIDG